MTGPERGAFRGPFPRPHKAPTHTSAAPFRVTSPQLSAGHTQAISPSMPSHRRCWECCLLREGGGGVARQHGTHIEARASCSHPVSLTGPGEAQRRTGMPRVSSMRLGTWRADRPRRMASRMRFTRSGWKVCLDAIFRNRTTRSSPSLLYWGTHRLSSTSSKASTVEAERKIALHEALQRPPC